MFPRVLFFAPAIALLQAGLPDWIGKLSSEAALIVIAVYMVKQQSEGQRRFDDGMSETRKCIEQNTHVMAQVLEHLRK